MKRWGLLLFTMFYLFVASGITIGGHYCMGHLQSVSVFVEANGKSCCCEDKSDCSCCESKNLKITDSDSHSYTVAPCVACSFECAASSEFLWQEIIFPPVVHTSAVTHPPPIVSNRPVHLKNSVFRI